MAKSDKEFYTDAANFLRKIGVGVTYKGNKKASPQQKSAVKKYWNLYGGYNNDRIKFVKVTGVKKEAMRGLVSSEQVTPRGIILVIPRGVDKKSFKYKIKGKGEDAYIQNDISGTRQDRTVKLDPVKLAIDPVLATRDAIARVHPELKKIPVKNLSYGLKGALQALKKVKGKPQFVKLVVNGNEQHNGADFASFFAYLDQLYTGENDKQESSNEEYAESQDREEGKKRARRFKSDEQFSDIFHVKLIYNKTL